MSDSGALLPLGKQLLCKFSCDRALQWRNKCVQEAANGFLIACARAALAGAPRE